MSSTKRDTTIDILKGLAIILVIVGHYYSPSISKYIIWSFHMPLFVLISGLFLKRDFGVARVIKITKTCLIPYTIVFFINQIFLIIKLLIKGQLAEYSCINVLLSFVYAVGSNSVKFKPEYVFKVGVIWFLMALFISKIIITFVITYVRKTHNQVLIISALWIAAAFLYQICCLPFGFLNGLSFLPWLYTGFRLRDNLSKTKFDNLLIYFASLIVWIAIVVFQFIKGYSFSITDLSIPQCVVGALGACAAIYFVYFSVRKIETSKDFQILSFFSKIGSSTIWILCIHGIGIESFSEYFSNLSNVLNFRGNDLMVMLIRLGLDLFLGIYLKQIYVMINKK